jgi:hypothetical protein
MQLFRSRERKNFPFRGNGPARNSRFYADRSAFGEITLYNRLEQLKLYKQELKSKRTFFFTNESLENLLRIVDVEMEKVQVEIARMAAKTENES